MMSWWLVMLETLVAGEAGCLKSMGEPMAMTSVTTWRALNSGSWARLMTAEPPALWPMSAISAPRGTPWSATALARERL